MKLFRVDNRECCKAAPHSNGAPPLNSFNLFISGYNYPVPPVWYDSMGNRMRPIKTSMNRSLLSKHRVWIYDWTFYTPVLPQEQQKEYKVSTQGKVAPIIHYLYAGKNIQQVIPTYLGTHNGYTLWSIVV